MLKIQQIEIEVTSVNGFINVEGQKMAFRASFNPVANLWKVSIERGLQINAEVQGEAISRLKTELFSKRSDDTTAFNCKLQ